MDQNIKILDETKDISKIIHLSDIHIRKIRVDEYRYVFNRTFEKIRQLVGQDDENTLIVICGDITDNKLMLTPVIIDLLKDFLLGLSEIAEIMIILGNHDVAISNKDALDAITPIIKNLDTENAIYLLKENKLYIYGNLLVGVTNIYAKKVTPISQDILEKYADKTRIALYHGTIKGSKSESGFEFTNSGYFKIQDFTKYYEYGFFGDIHKFQYLNNNKTFAYSSSLIEQRISEANQYHGFIYWNIKERKSTYVNVKSKYRYMILNVDNGELTVTTRKGVQKYNDVQFPEFPKIRLYYKNTSMTKINEIENMIKKEHNVIEFIKMNDYNDDLELDYGIDNNEDTDKVVEIKDYGTIEKLIKGFIKKNKVDWTTDKIQKILDLLKDIVGNINIGSHEKRTIKLKSLEFNNLFSYGQNNKIDFDKLAKNKITGILGSNGHGKSTLIDSLLYSIYDKFSRGENNEALNVNEKFASSKINLMVNNSEYVIERKIKKVGKRITPVLTLQKDNKVITNDRKSETTKDIQDYICKYEDIVDNNIILQYCDNFLDMADTKKRDYLYRILNLDIFNDIVKETNSKKGIIVALKNARIKNLKQYDEKKISENMENLKNKLDSHTDQIINLKKNKKKNEEELLDLKIKIGDINIDIKTVTKHIKQLEENKENKNKEIGILNAKIKKLKEKNDIMVESTCSVKHKIKELEEKNVVEKHEEFIRNKENALKELNKKRDTVIRDIIYVEHTEDEISEVIEKYKDKISKYETKIENINDKLIKLSKLNKKLEKKIIDIDNFEDIEKKYNVNIELTKQINKKKETVKDLDDNIIKFNKKMDRIKDHKYDINCECCMASETTKEKLYFMEQIEECKCQIKKENKNIIKLEKDLDNDIEQEYKVIVQAKSTNLETENKIVGNNHSIEIIKKDLEIVRNKNLQTENNIDKYEKMLSQVMENGVLENELKIINSKINDEQLKDDINYTNYLQLTKELQELEKDMMDIDKQMFEKEKKLSTCHSELTELQNMYNEKAEIIEKIEQNSNVIEEIEELENDNEMIDKNIDEHDDNIKHINKMIIQYECDIKKIEEIKKEIEDCIIKYDMYIEINNIIETKNGLVNHIMNNIVLVQLESKVNKILNLLTDFTVQLEYNNKRIIVYKIEDEQKIKASNLCGFERFICNMVFRLVFNQINCKVKCDFLIIDEGFSCCDQDNLIKLRSLFDFIRQKYKWCLVITHLEMIKDNFDEMLNIEKIGGRSSIVF